VTLLLADAYFLGTCMAPARADGTSGATLVAAGLVATVVAPALRLSAGALHGSRAALLSVVV